MASVAKPMPFVAEPLSRQFQGFRRMLSKDIDQSLHGHWTWPQGHVPEPTIIIEIGAACIDGRLEASQNTSDPQLHRYPPQHRA